MQARQCVEFPLDSSLLIDTGAGKPQHTGIHKKQNIFHYLPHNCSITLCIALTSEIEEPIKALI
jgi:hypothetical protein